MKRLRTAEVLSAAWNAAVLAVVAGTALAAAAGGDVKNLGSDREVMWDMGRIAALGGGAALRLHSPQLREVSLVHDAPWEGNVCCYTTVFRDETNFKMYYRGASYNMPGRTNHQVVCYAESDDGVVWRKPNLGICEFNGSKANNIILKDDVKEAAHNFSPFFDTNPACKPNARYKAVAGLGGGLFGLVSLDGVHWRKIRSKPIITKGAFDSQNIVFWDKARKSYVAYYRTFWKGPDGKMLRGIQWATSPDFLSWSDPKWVEYDTDSPNDQLYTNAIQPYERARGIYVGFPKRFTEGRSSVYDKTGAGGIPGVSDGVFMSSRDGALFKRWSEAFLRPGLQHERWVNRNNMTAWGCVQTKSSTPGCPDELSLYSTENYYARAEPNRLRRMTVRLDGFVSVNAPWRGGTVTTKPLVFAAAPDGKATRLLLNASTSGAGHIKCEVRGEDGRALPGFSLADAKEVFGDEIELAMEWKDGADLAALAGRTISLHFEMKDADIYSYVFR